jgi:transposase
VKGQNFSEDFQKSVVSKYLNRGNRTADSIAQDVGVSIASIYGWAKKYGNVQNMTNKSGRKPNDRKAQEKFQLVIKYFSLSEEERGKFLRENGLHSDHLEQWKITMESGFNLKPKSSELADERNKNKILEREIRRKDKALAEAAALIILKKKPTYSGERTRTSKPCGQERNYFIDC